MTVYVIAGYDGQPALRVDARDKCQFGLTLVVDMERLAPIHAVVRILAGRVMIVVQP